VRTDRDGDGLAENAGVGHGWLEGGTLAQHVSIEVYLAAYTVRAWSAVAVLGTALGDEPLATTGAAHATRAREALRTRFFRVEDGGFTHAIRTDGSRDDRDAITSVMPWTLAIGEHGRESDALRRFSTARAQADWGSRMLPTDDPAYDPASYQAGSVWPLFSAWANLADFQYGRADTAWLRLLPLLRSVEQFAPGCVQEVFRGDVYRPRGIAAMQAWSHAAILSGFAQGLLGARESPDDGHVVLEPTLPGGLDGLEFAGLQIRGATLSGRLARGEGGAGLEVELTLEGEPLELELAPFFPAPARVRGVTHDGVSLAMHEEALGDGVLVRTRVPLGAGSTKLRFDVLPDLLVAIEMPPLVQDRESSGPRFLGRRRVDADTVALAFELCAPASFPIRTPGRAVLAVTGAEQEADGSALRVTPAAGTGHRALRGRRPLRSAERLTSRSGTAMSSSARVRDAGAVGRGAARVPDREALRRAPVQRLTGAVRRRFGSESAREEGTPDEATHELAPSCSSPPSGFTQRGSRAARRVQRRHHAVAATAAPGDRPVGGQSPARSEPARLLRRHDRQCADLQHRRHVGDGDGDARDARAAERPA
jgi:hypothetical protein